MILGIGVDLCSIARIETSIERFGMRFINRIYTLNEQERAETRGARKFDRYAQMFAAKEAAAKALGTGFRNGVEWKDLEVSTNDLGRPQLILRGGAADYFQALVPLNMEGHADLALTDESGLAQAMVVLYYAPSNP